MKWEKAGFMPKPIEKHSLKVDVPDIKFTTPEWQEWLSEYTNV